MVRGFFSRSTSTGHRGPPNGVRCNQELGGGSAPANAERGSGVTESQAAT